MKNRGLRRATVGDVAERCGEPLQTVSRILNGNAGAHPRSIIRRVERAAEELGYIGDGQFLDQSIARSSTIGIISKGEASMVTDAFYQGIQEELVKREYLPIMLTANETTPADVLVNLLLKRNVSGIIIRPDESTASEVQRLVANHNIPVVSFDQPLASRGTFDHVGPNIGAGIRDVLKKLSDSGVRQVSGVFHESRAFFGETLKQEIRAFSHLDCETMTVPEIESSDPLRSFVKSRQDHGAILACGIPMLNLINQEILSLELGDKLQVIGFGCTSQMKYLSPTTSLLSLDSYSMGRQAAQLMVSRIDSAGRTMPAREVLFDPVLSSAE